MSRLLSSTIAVFLAWPCAVHAADAKLSVAAMNASHRQMQHERSRWCRRRVGLCDTPLAVFSGRLWDDAVKRRAAPLTALFNQPTPEVLDVDVEPGKIQLAGHAEPIADEKTAIPPKKGPAVAEGDSDENKQSSAPDSTAPTGG